ncbi:glutaredoxin family protein [Alteromonas sp.]|jgi:hypothetical protein|nr:glutaredoxin family protein [Alteromonas sp.]
MKIFFYTGPQCSLCDHADTELANTSHYRTLSIEKVNVRENSELYHLYGARIPVLKRDDNGSEIGWPFSTADLEEFLQ